MSVEQRARLACFADLLEYPGADLQERVRRLSSTFGPEPDVEGAVNALGGEPLARVQERYTTTFDLSPVCCPYVGYHLFGESFKRGALMSMLRQTYAAQAFTLPEWDLPDHLSAIVRFAAVCEDDELAREIAIDLIAPALRTMIAALDGGNPYGALLRALGATLEALFAAVPVGGTRDV
ncbi:nitrate reductase molybdenum cofactor assembly chaperone [bacterium]|nr:MAG: nitrate reductase molybdenum cofactor assembly chaperone [bacterium]